MKTNDAKFRAETGIWTLPKAENVLVVDKDYQIGDLVIISNRALLIVEFCKDKIGKKILIQWADNG